MVAHPGYHPYTIKLGQSRHDFILKCENKNKKEHSVWQYLMTLLLMHSYFYCTGKPCHRRYALLNRYAGRAHHAGKHEVPVCKPIGFGICLRHARKESRFTHNVHFVFRDLQARQARLVLLNACLPPSGDGSVRPDMLYHRHSVVMQRAVWVRGKKTDTKHSSANWGRP